MIEKTMREIELRKLMEKELYQDECLEDYEVALSGRYDFTYCPDEYEFLADNMEDFELLCKDFSVSDDDVCEKCWKGFLSGVKC